MSFYYPFILARTLGSINILTTYKLGSRYTKNYGNTTEYIDDILKLATDRFTSAPTYIVIREPYKRLLSGIHTIILFKCTKSFSNENYLNFSLVDSNQKDIKIKLPSHDMWRGEHGYKVYLYLLNKFWWNFKVDSHISPWLNTVEEIIDAHPNFKLIDIKSLTDLILLQGIKLNENSESVYRHSNYIFYESISKALTSPDLKPYIKSFLDNLLNMEKQSYERLKDKIVKIDKPYL